MTDKPAKAQSPKVPETWKGEVHHFVENVILPDGKPIDSSVAGLLEIEKMNEEVNAAWQDLKGGDTTADPVATAKSYLKRVERVPKMERVLREILRVGFIVCVCELCGYPEKAPPGRPTCFHCQIREALGEK